MTTKLLKSALPRIAFAGLLAGFLLGGCSHFQKKISPKRTYRAGYLGSSDGLTFKPLIDLLDDAQRAKSACRALERHSPIRAQYKVTRNDRAISVKILTCESADATNCTKLDTCLQQRPVAWMSRATGIEQSESGAIYSDWLGKCGGEITVNFYLTGASALPTEKVSCVEPAHDAVDTAYELFLISKPDTESSAAIGPYIEVLLRRWNNVVFNEGDALPGL